MSEASATPSHRACPSRGSSGFMEDAFRKSAGESHYVRCMTEATRVFVEQKRAASEKQTIFTCPPLPEMMDMAQQVMDKAAAVTKKKTEFRKLRKSVSGIHKSLMGVGNQAILRTTCGEAVTALHMPLVEAGTLTSQYSADGWVERKFLMGGNVEFDKKFLPLLPKLEKGGARLIATIKIIKDAVKTGMIAASDPELEGSALTEATLQAHAAIMEAGGVDAKAADRTFVAEGKEEIREDLGETESVASSDAGGTDIGDLDGASNIQAIAAMVKKELEENPVRKPKHGKDKGCGQDPVMLAFAGDFWSIARIGDEGGNPGEMDKSGQTYGVLHQAVFRQDLDGVCLLTGRGLDPDPKTKRLCPTLGVKSGSTPLHLAAIIGNVMIVKQLICDGANVDATDVDGKTPHEVATTNECKAAIEGADRLRGMQVQFGVLVAAGNWEEAMKLIYAVERDASGRAIHIGLPANTVLPGRPRTRAFPEGIPLSERFCAIHVAARQEDIVPYAQLVHAGAIPLQVDGSDACKGKLPSDLCGEGDVKQILKQIEGLLAPGELDLGRGEVGPNGRYLVKPPEPDLALPALLEEEEGASVDAGAPPASLE